LPGEMFWRLWRKDWSAGDAAGNCTEECDLDEIVSGFGGARTGRIVHEVVCADIRDVGCHGAIAT
jgi:hypothetical protein